MLGPWLFAAVDLSAVSRGAQAKRSISLADNWFLIAAVLGIAAVWIGLYFWDKHRKRLKRASSSSPKSLFLELCQAHQLNRTERSRVAHVAAEKQLSHAGLVFVDPLLLQDFAQGDDPEHEEYALLLRKLFGQT